MSNTITIDLETYYDQDYSLSKMTTAEYVNGPKFEVILLSYAVNDEEPVVIDGFDTNKLRQQLQALPWEESTLVAHNAIFDASILNWKFGIKPKKFFCTMQAARPNIVPYTGSMSLAKVAEHLQLGKKGTEVLQMKGINRALMRPSDFMAYSTYCQQDVLLTREIYKKIAPRPATKRTRGH